MQRVAFLRGNLDRADVSVAEKFRQVMEAYNIELQYGRGIETYRDTIDVSGDEDWYVMYMSASETWHMTRIPSNCICI